MSKAPNCSIKLLALDEAAGVFEIPMRNLRTTFQECFPTNIRQHANYWFRLPWHRYEAADIEPTANVVAAPHGSEMFYITTIEGAVVSGSYNRQ